MPEAPITKAVKSLHPAKILCGDAVTTLFIRPMGPIKKVVAYPPLLVVVKITSTSQWVPILKGVLVKIRNLDAVLMTFLKHVDLSTKVILITLEGLLCKHMTLRHVFVFKSNFYQFSFDHTSAKGKGLSYVHLRTHKIKSNFLLNQSFGI